MTPWGPSTTRTIFHVGIIFYTTEGHGGFWLSPERIAALPPELMSLGTWAGQPWYEEDCDANLVIVAHPTAFTDVEVYNAYEFLMSPNRPGYLDGVDLWLQSPATAAVRVIALAVAEKYKSHYRFAGAITHGDGWSIRAVTLDKKNAIIIRAKEYPQLEPFFTLEDVAKAGGEVLKTLDREEALAT